MASRNTFKLASTVRLAAPSGHVEMPVVGFGVYQSTDTLSSSKTAFDAGYRHIDTARAYKSESVVNDALSASGIKRSDVFLTTKVMSGEHGYDACAKAVESSAQALGGGVWDLYLIHAPTAGKQKRIEAFKALADAQKAGKIRAIGVSNYGVHHLKELEDSGAPTPAVNQIELHPWCQQRPIVDYCAGKGIVVEAYCPLVRGKYMTDPTLTSVASKHSRTPAQVLVRWSLQKGFVPLPKSDNPARIRENIDVFGFELDAEDVKALDGLDRGDDGAVSWNPIHAP